MNRSAKIKFYGLFAAMCAFAGFILWLVFGPSPFEMRTLYERHSVVGAPEIEILTYGLVDSAFDACLINLKGRRVQIASSLPCRNKPMSLQANPARKTYLENLVLAPAIRTRNGAALFEVFWTKDFHRVAICFNGYMVHAYDLRHQRIVGCANDDEPLEHCDRRIFESMQSESSSL